MASTFAMEPGGYFSNRPAKDRGAPADTLKHDMPVGAPPATFQKRLAKGITSADYSPPTANAPT